MAKIVSLKAGTFMCKVLKGPRIDDQEVEERTFDLRPVTYELM